MPTSFHLRLRIVYQKSKQTTHSLLFYCRKDKTILSWHHYLSEILILTCTPAYHLTAPDDHILPHLCDQEL